MGRPCTKKEDLPTHLIPLNDGLEEVAILMRSHFEYIRSHNRIDDEHFPDTDTAFSKGAVILLCAYWESFVEDLALAAIDALLANDVPADRLPISLRKKLAAQLKADKNELAIWSMANDGWKSCCRSLVETRINSLNKPCIANIQTLYKDLYGIEICDNWTWRHSGPETGEIDFDPENTKRFIDALVDARNAFAHGRIPSLNLNLAFLVHQASGRIFKVATIMSSFLSDEVKSLTGTRPWARIDFLPDWKQFLIRETASPDVAE